MSDFDALEQIRELAPSCSVTHYAELKLSDQEQKHYQFFMIKDGKSFTPVVGLVFEDVVSWVSVNLTNSELNELKELNPK